LALGLFIHNAIITIMSNNKHQENNVRKKGQNNEHLDVVVRVET